MGHGQLDDVAVTFEHQQSLRLKIHIILKLVLFGKAHKIGYLMIYDHPQNMDFFRVVKFFCGFF